MLKRGSLDSVNFHALARETEPILRSTRLQKFSQLTTYDFVLSFRAPGQTHRLLVSLHPEQSRFHLVTTRQPPAQIPSAFVMLGRKHLQGIFLSGFEHRDLERVLHLVFENRWRLVVEMPGRPNNLVLVKPDGTVAQSFTRDDRTRAKSTYQWPPRPTKPVANQVPAGELKSLLETVSGSLSERLLRCCFGLSKPCARQLAAEDSLEALVSGWSLFWKRLEEGPWQPGLSQGELTFLAQPGDLIYPTMSAAAEARWQTASRAPGLEDERKELTKRLTKLRQKASLKKERRLTDLKRAQSAASDKMKADLLLSYSHQVPPGSDIVTLNDWNGQPVPIALDGRLSVADNAQRLYQRYKKKQRAVEFLQEQVPQAQHEIDFLDELLLAVELSQSKFDLAEIRQALPSRAGRRRLAQPSSGPRRFLHRGTELLVGRNPIQNDQLRHQAAQEDLWFHARDIPGSHVIIRTAGAEPHPSTLEAAATLAGRFSKASQSPKVTVNYTLVKYLKKPPGSPPGRVLYRKEKTMVVDPTRVIEGLESL